jgi:putative IMPACT (imprinted ancient) family translation regulator
MTMMKMLFIMTKVASTTSAAATSTTTNNKIMAATKNTNIIKQKRKYNNWFSTSINRSKPKMSFSSGYALAFVDPTTLRSSRSRIQSRSTIRSIIMTTSIFATTAAQRNSHYHNHNKNLKFASSALFSSSSSSSSSEVASGAESSTSSTSISAEVQRTLAKQPVLSLESESDDDNNNDSSYSKPKPYYIYESEQTIKKSRFIGLARYANNWEDASAFIQEIKTKVHPKARHWCYAYRGSIIGGGSEAVDTDDETDEADDSSSSSSFDASTTITERASDDGEPTGTAGQPILNSLKTEGNLIDVVIIVIRYSGGIKLGAGGLIRAYGGTARQVLQENKTNQIIIIPKQTLIIENLQPKYVGSLYDIASKYNAIISSNDYINFNLVCDSNIVPKIKEHLRNSTRGSVIIR